MSALVEEWERFFEELSRFPDDLQGKIEHANKVLNYFLAGIPSRLTERIQVLWDKIREYTRVIVDWFREEVLPVLVSPWTLWSTGQDWTQEVFSKVSDIQGRLESSRMTVDDYWHGPAARAYLQVIEGQRNAANAVSETANATRETLQKLGIGIGAVYIGLIGEGLFLSVEIDGGTALLFGGITIPEGLAVILLGLAKFMMAIGGAVAAWKMIAEDGLSAFAELKAAANDNRSLDRGAWPQGRADLADSSMVTGDRRSGWTYYGDPVNS